MIWWTLGALFAVLLVFTFAEAWSAPDEEDEPDR